MSQDNELPETPFPFHSVSNGEWCAPAPDARQRAAAKLYIAESERRARRLGMTRREFMRSAAGTATAFMVLNQVSGLACTGPEAVLPVTNEQCDDPNAAAALFDSDFFVMDVQLHHVDTDTFPQSFWSDLRFYHPDDPSDLTDAEKARLLSQTNFIKEVFVDSETAVGVISGVPEGTPLPVETMSETRDLVNDLAGSERALVQAMIEPNHPFPASQTGLESMPHQVIDNDARAIKCYTGSGGWWLDDETIAYPMYAEARRLNVSVINVHKGFPGLLGPGSDLYVTTRDLDKATHDWPDLDFVVYHAGYFPAPGDGITGFLTDVASMGPRSNLFAEIGSSFANSVFVPDEAAHLIGRLTAALGSERILWGTDSVWWGSPQWQIDVFKALQIPESMQMQYGYPALTDADKARILGLNAAALYGVDVAATRCQIAADELTAHQIRQGGRGATRSHYAYGPTTPEQYHQLVAHAGERSA